MRVKKKKPLTSGCFSSNHEPATCFLNLEKLFCLSCAQFIHLWKTKWHYDLFSGAVRRCIETLTQCWHLLCISSRFYASTSLSLLQNIPVCPRWLPSALKTRNDWINRLCPIYSLIKQPGLYNYNSSFCDLSGEPQRFVSAFSEILISLGLGKAIAVSWKIQEVIGTEARAFHRFGRATCCLNEAWQLPWPVVGG